MLHLDVTSLRHVVRGGGEVEVRSGGEVAALHGRLFLTRVFIDCSPSLLTLTDSPRLSAGSIALLCRICKRAEGVRGRSRLGKYTSHGTRHPRSLSLRHRPNAVFPLRANALLLWTTRFTLRFVSSRVSPLLGTNLRACPLGQILLYPFAIGHIYSGLPPGSLLPKIYAAGATT
jgi:hypothetical protein